MKIISINITEFGALCDLNLDLCDGLNVIEGLNESGKSTLNAFIRFALYGLSSARRSGTTLTDRKYYPSFKNGLAVGSMTVEHEGRLYRIERRGQQSATYRESVAVFDALTGDKLVIKGEPGEHFLGVSEEVFESTCCIRQNELRDVDGSGVSDAIQNMLVSADKDIDIDKARRRLDAVRKTLKLQKGSGGRISELEAEIASLELRLRNAESFAAELSAKRAEADRKRQLSKELRDRANALATTLALYDDYAKLLKLEELGGLRKKVEDIEARIEKLKFDYNCGGFVPDKQFYDELRRVELEIPQKDTAVERASLFLDQAKGHALPDPLLCEGAEKIDKFGGADTVQELFRIRRRAAKGKKLTGILFFLFALIAGGVGAALGFMVAPILFTVAGAGALLLVLAIVMLSLGAKDKRAIRSLLAAIGYDTVRLPDLFELQTYMGDCRSAALELENVKRSVTAAQNALEERRKELEAVLDDAATLLIPYGDTVEPIYENRNQLLDSIRDTARSVLEFLDKYAELIRELDVGRKVADSLASALAGADEADIRARLGEGRISEFSRTTREKIAFDLSYAHEALRSNEDARIDADKRFMELDKKSEDPSKLLAELTQKRRELEKLRFALSAIMLATESCEVASNNLRHSVTPRLCRLASDNMKLITDGKYESLLYDASSRLLVVTDATRDIDTLSCGTKDAAYLSLRLAMTKLLFGDSTALLTVDEGLASLDDTRASSFLSMLTSYAENGAQCLLFTCHKREAEMLGNAGARFKLIRI